MKALTGQLVQLFLSGGLPLLQVHGIIGAAVDQCFHRRIGLGHLGGIGAGQRCLGVVGGCVPGGQGRRAGQGQRQCEGADGAEGAPQEVRTVQIHCLSSQYKAGPAARRLLSL